jgi:CheY-like chemotaxis protein/HPt (histidine-containing phosphotransfer) domain-containing protein
MKDNILNALVIDDNEVNTIVLANMLELFGITSDQANNGFHALELLTEKEYGIVFMDHVMPIMDGVQTTKAIRDLPDPYNRIIIIALTSSVTEEIRRLYQCCGANDVYAKPLGLLELATILKQWCLQSSDMGITALEESSTNYDDSIIKDLVMEISEINYDIGLRYAIGDPKHYINILRISLKDIKTCLDLVLQGHENEQLNDIRIGVHNMKSVFTNIGALELAGLANNLEQSVIKLDVSILDSYYHYFTERILSFYKKLEGNLAAYDVMMNKMLQEEKLCLSLTREEYEQSICNTIYYIKRFDYSAILEKLEILIKRGRPEYRGELELAIEEIKNYQYENTLLRLTSIKNEMDRSSISAEAD